jgi:hypothetical protein
LQAHWIPTKAMHLNHKLRQKNNIHLNYFSSFSRSPIIALRMLEHSKAMLEEFQWFLEHLCFKAKIVEK